jgi:glutathione S-transferase
MASLEFVDVATARDAGGVRLIVLADVPSPWSQSAKAIFEYKGIPAVAVRMQTRDDAVRSWTGMANAPIALYGRELPRTGWAEILGLAERLEPKVPLIPTVSRERVLMHGLSHELMGENGLLWNLRLMTIDASIASSGKLCWPLPLANFLGRRYGHVHGIGSKARARALELLALFDAQLQTARAAGHRYFLGDRPTALDIYAATTMNTIVPLPHELCAMHPVGRTGYEFVQSELGAGIPKSLVEHRDLMYRAHLTLPMQL